MGGPQGWKHRETLRKSLEPLPMDHSIQLSPQNVVPLELIHWTSAPLQPSQRWENWVEHLWLLKGHGFHVKDLKVYSERLMCELDQVLNAYINDVKLFKSFWSQACTAWKRPAVSSMSHSLKSSHPQSAWGNCRCRYAANVVAAALQGLWSEKTKHFFFSSPGSRHLLSQRSSNDDEPQIFLHLKHSDFSKVGALPCPV